MLDRLANGQLLGTAAPVNRTIFITSKECYADDDTKTHKTLAAHLDIQCFLISFFVKCRSEWSGQDMRLPCRNSYRGQSGPLAQKQTTCRKVAALQNFCKTLVRNDLSLFVHVHG